MNKKELNSIWKELLSEHIKQLFDNPNIYHDCVENTYISQIEGDKIYIVVPSVFAKSILVNDYKDEIDRLIQKRFGGSFESYYILGDEEKLIQLDDTVRSNFIHEQENKFASGLTDDYTLDDFIVGKFNNSCYQAIKTIIDKNKVIYNPLFIYGSTGLGKTHLLIGLGNSYKKKYPHKKIRYIATDEFVRKVFETISKGSSFVEDLKNELATVDLLLIDDIQHMSNKDKTNEVFFTIFNRLVNEKKQIVITADKTPDNLNGFEERMVSRFSSGLTLKIAIPEVESIKKIIIQKIKESESEFSFSDDAIDELIKYFNNDLRKLIGIINNISFSAIQSSEQISVISKPILKKFLEEYKTIKLNLDYSINPDVIISSICKYNGVSEESVKGKIRTKNITNVRHICMYILRQKYNLSYKEIGSYFSNRDHTTIMDAVKKIDNRILKDEKLKEYIELSIEKV